jgi:hypothetical protein
MTFSVNMPQSLGKQKRENQYHHHPKPIEITQYDHHLLSTINPKPRLKVGIIIIIFYGLGFREEEDDDNIGFQSVYGLG